MSSQVDFNRPRAAPQGGELRPVETLLARLDGVRQTGPAKWRARCPSHGSKSRTLAIAECDDGRVLIRCFAECRFDQVLAAVGLKPSDLFPRQWRPVDSAQDRRRRPPWRANDVLDLVVLEAHVIADVAAQMARSRSVSEDDAERLAKAVSRLCAIKVELGGAANGLG